MAYGNILCAVGPVHAPRLTDHVPQSEALDKEACLSTAEFPQHRFIYELSTYDLLICFTHWYRADQ